MDSQVVSIPEERSCKILSGCPGAVKDRHPAHHHGQRRISDG